MRSLVLLVVMVLVPLMPIRSWSPRAVFAATNPTVTVVGSATTVRPTDPMPPVTNVATISAAQNEFEAFQIVVQAGDAPISNFRASAGDR